MFLPGIIGTGQGEMQDIPTAAVSVQQIQDTTHAKVQTTCIERMITKEDGSVWAQTQNFMIYHYNSRELPALAERVERIRAETVSRWLHTDQEPLRPRCVIRVHAPPIDKKITSSAITSLGFSKGKVSDSTINIFLNSTNTLSHEIAHVVMAQKVGKPIRRWADESLASLNEPLEEDRKAVSRIMDSFSPHEHYNAEFLLSTDEYPESKKGKNWFLLFYAQSIDLGSFLVEQKGERAFGEFIQVMCKKGTEAALRQCYGYENVTALDEAWKSARSTKIAAAK